MFTPESPPTNVNRELPKAEISLEKYFARVHADAVSAEAQAHAALAERVELLHEMISAQFAEYKVTHAREHRTGQKVFDEKLADSNEQTRVAFASAKALTDAVLAASNAAIEKALVATERRFDSVNEFRAQSLDQAARFAVREVVDSKIDALTAITTANATAIASIRSSMVTAGAALTLFLTAIEILLKFLHF